MGYKQERVLQTRLSSPAFRAVRSLDKFCAEFGEEEHEEATVMLMAKLGGRENSNQHIQARKAVEDAQQIARQFRKTSGEWKARSDEREAWELR
jgi:hypothetical protein